jgi:hypothetical protein
MLQRFLTARYRPGQQTRLCVLLCQMIAGRHAFFLRLRAITGKSYLRGTSAADDVAIVVITLEFAYETLLLASRGSVVTGTCPGVDPGLTASLKGVPRWQC